MMCVSLLGAEGTGVAIGVQGVAIDVQRVALGVQGVANGVQVTESASLHKNTECVAFVPMLSLQSDAECQHRTSTFEHLHGRIVPMSDHGRTMRSATIKFLGRVVPRVQALHYDAKQQFCLYHDERHKPCFCMQDGKGLVDFTDGIRHLAAGVASSQLPDNSASMTAVKVQAIVTGAWKSVHKQLQEAPPEKLDELTAMHKITWRSQEGRAWQCLM
ncbi:hypothetical protein HaLaN_22847, partial [Haematococcus lacustris]